MMILMCVFLYVVIGAAVTAFIVHKQQDGYVEGWEMIVGIFWPAMIPMYVGWYGMKWLINNVKVERGE